MGVINRAFGLLGYQKTTVSEKAVKFNSRIRFMRFTGDGCKPPFELKLGSMGEIRDAYIKCSPVSTIINRLADSMANGKLWILDGENNDVSEKYADVYNLLNKPNPFQTWTEFIKQIDLHWKLYGITYVYAVTPVGFSISDSSMLWPVNPENVEVKYKSGITPYNHRNIDEIIDSYIIAVDNGKTITVEPQNMLRIVDSFSWNGRTFSRIEGLKYEINNIVQAQEAIYSLNHDRGAMGILSNRSHDVSGPVPLVPGEKDNIYKAYNDEYGIREKKEKILITESDLLWQPMTFNVKDLMLIEGIKQNIERIADAYNYPFHLLANERGTTFNNVSGFEKYLYQDNIIPCSKIYAEKLTRFFGIKDAFISLDFSDVEYLKEAEKEQAEAKHRLAQALDIPFKSGIITKEEYRKFLDLDETATGNTYYNENGNEQQTAG